MRCSDDWQRFADKSCPHPTEVSYVYDTLNRLTTLTSGFAGQFTFGYDALSRRTSLSRPNTVNTTYTYDSVSRLLSVVHQLGATTIDGASYGLDPAGNRVSKTNYIDGSNENYSYDALYQLTQVLHNGTTSESYTYDGVGNRLSSLGVPSYTYNTSNELTVDSAASFTYDSDGNTTSKTDTSGTTNYTWDFENRLVSVALPGTGGTVTFKYDPFGRRIQKASPSGTINFAYDGANVVEELNSAGTATAQYAQGTGVDEPLATNRGGALALYEADGVGSVTSLTNGAGSALAAYTADSFGNPVSTADTTVNNPFRYAGREYDPETGLYYYRARYYSPTEARFLREDPIGILGGPNLYAYVGNSPLDFIDPSGEAGFGVIGGVSAGLGGVGPSAAGTATVQTGIFWGGIGGINTGQAGTTGGFDNPFNCACTHNRNAYPADQPPGVAVGAWGGPAAGLFFTNATDYAELHGDFTNVELHLLVVDLALAKAPNGVWQLSVTRGPVPGLGFARYHTNTLTGRSCHNRPLEFPNPDDHYPVIPVGDGMGVTPDPFQQ